MVVGIKGGKYKYISIYKWSDSIIHKTYLYLIQIQAGCSKQIQAGCSKQIQAGCSKQNVNIDTSLSLFKIKSFVNMFLENYLGVGH